MGITYGTCACGSPIEHHRAHRCPSCVRRAVERRRRRDPEPSRHYLAYIDAAELLGVSIGFIRAHRQQIGFVKLGGLWRVSRTSLEEYFAGAARKSGE